ncbi:MAG: hypothetical protein A2Z32_01610 [Chloroflexi bacterium RBG_16_69_14]|nr:MAG: hypothetical protein A2Z32_01610 [Chloroflexi bacterium RBG_16_69_14]
MRTLVSASWTTRSSWISARGGRALRAVSSHVKVALMPVCRAYLAMYSRRAPSSPVSDEMVSRRPRIASRTSR